MPHTTARPTPEAAPRRPGGPDRTRRRPVALLIAAALLLASAVAGGGPAAQAADTPKTGLGKDGQQLTVSASAKLDPDGETIRVTGAGYDETKGVYVAICKDNGDNRIPAPCLGGAGMGGDGGSPAWIVPRGDPYEGDLATAYGDGGTFDVTIRAEAQGSGLDCLRVTCSVVTRVDHRAGGDRSQDVRIPVTFTGQDPGGGGDGIDVPPGTVAYHPSAEFTDAGKPLDVLVHPDSGKLYVGSDDIPDTAGEVERGLYVLDAADGAVRSRVEQAPGPDGALAGRTVRQIVAPLAGDGVAFHYPLRGIGTARDGDEAAAGVWLTGPAVTGAGPGTTDSTVLVAQGAALSEVRTATGAVTRTTTLDGGGKLAVDPAHDAAWSTGNSGGTLRRVDTRSFTVTATAPLPDATTRFVEADPATGNVWVGSGRSVLVLDRNAELLTAITAPGTGADQPAAAAFDAATGTAFVLWQDYGNSDDGADNAGSLGAYGTATHEPAAEPVPLPGNRAEGYAGIAVTPGAASVYVTNSAEAEVVKLDRRVSPRVTRAPTDQAVTAGETVTLTAAAEGAPTPTVRWQVSSDGGQTWSAVDDAVRGTLAFTARAAHDGHRYRAEFTNAADTTRTAPVTLTVTGGGGPGGGDPGGDPGRKPWGTKTGTGPEGQKLTVTPVNDLAHGGQQLRISGRGYNPGKGVHVALCVDNRPGEPPTPCIGGVDTTGASRTSAWISSNPPDHGGDLAIPYGRGGTFDVRLTVDAKDEYTDCLRTTCAVVTRADHTRSGDRSQDVMVPVSFSGQDPVDTDDDPGTGGDDDGATDRGGATGGGSTDARQDGTAPPSDDNSSGSLASTGVTALALAATAALLTTAGWLTYRQGRRTRGLTNG